MHEIYIRRSKQWCVRLSLFYYSIIIQLCKGKARFPFYGTFNKHDNVHLASCYQRMNHKIPCSRIYNVYTPLLNLKDAKESDLFVTIIFVEYRIKGWKYNLSWSDFNLNVHFKRCLDVPQTLFLLHYFNIFWVCFSCLFFWGGNWSNLSFSIFRPTVGVLDNTCRHKNILYNYNNLVLYIVWNMNCSKLSVKAHRSPLGNLLSSFHTWLLLQWSHTWENIFYELYHPLDRRYIR